MNSFYYTDLSDNVLFHHGIKGQQWGKRNGPPYPLEESDHSKSEVKAGWKRSLDRRKEYEKEKRERLSVAKKQYDEDSQNMSQYKAKKRFELETEKIKKSLSEKYPKEAKNDDLVRKIAIGVGIAAVVGATAYLAVDSKSYINSIAVQLDISSKYMDGKHRAASIISEAMDKDISLLSDDDEIITAGTTLQRVIRDYKHTDKAMSMEKAKELIYATFDENDNAIYQTLFNARGKGRKLITQRETISDLRMPSAFKRANAFRELLKTKEFRDAIETDLNRLFGSSMKFKKYTEGELFNKFNLIAGDSKSQSSKIYFKKITDMGYNAIRDDNDSGYLSKTPVILLNASNDTVVKGYKKATQISQMMARLRIEVVPEYDKKTIFR